MPSQPPNPGGQWRLVPYYAASGRCPVLEWLEGECKNKRPVGYVQFYDPKDGLKRRFEQHGPENMGRKLWQPLGDKLYEIRWCGPCRIYCSMESERRIIMYEGCLKRWPKFSHRSVCLTRRADFLSQGYDHELRELRYLALCQKRGQNGIT